MKLQAPFFCTYMSTKDWVKSRSGWLTVKWSVGDWYQDLRPITRHWGGCEVQWSVTKLKVSSLGHWTPTETASECIQLSIASALSLSDISTFVKKPALLTNSSPVLL